MSILFRNFNPAGAHLRVLVFFRIFFWAKAGYIRNPNPKSEFHMFKLVNPM